MADDIPGEDGQSCPSGQTELSVLTHPELSVLTHSGYFGAAKAPLVLAAFFIAQIVAAFVVLFLGAAVAVARGASLETPGLIERVTNDSVIVMLFATIFAGALAVALSLAVWGR